jgi:group I intron endonuclease
VIEVYCHTSPSGKQYVGIASGGWRARWRSHVFEARHGSPLPLHAAIRKYGPESFRHEVLECCESRAEAEAVERHWIAERGTKLPRGYNATDGGEGVAGLTLSRPRKPPPPVTDEARQRMRAAQLGVRRGPHSPEHRAKISAALTGRSQSASARDKLRAVNLGRTHSAETRAKMAEAQRQAHARRRERLTQIAAEVLYAEIHSSKT